MDQMPPELMNRFLNWYSTKHPTYSDTPGKGIRGFETMPGSSQEIINFQAKQNDVNYYNNLALELMAKRYPQKKQDLYDLYYTIQQDKFDQRLNDALFSRGMGQNDLRLREQNNLLNVPSNLPPGYGRDPSGGFSAYPKIPGWKPYAGRWM